MSESKPKNVRSPQPDDPLAQPWEREGNNPDLTDPASREKDGPDDFPACDRQKNKQILQLPARYRLICEPSDELALVFSPGI